MTVYPCSSILPFLTMLPKELAAKGLPVDPFPFPFNDPALTTYRKALLISADMQGKSELNSSAASTPSPLT